MNALNGAIFSGLINFLFFTIILPLLIISIILNISFLFTLRKNLNYINKKNIKIKPNLIMLNILPIFNIFWFIFSISKIKQSNIIELKSRDIKSEYKLLWISGKIFYILHILFFFNLIYVILINIIFTKFYFQGMIYYLFKYSVEILYYILPAFFILKFIVKIIFWISVSQINKIYKK